MKFKTNWSENKTSAKGAPYKRATLEDESGRIVENVAVFNSFKDFAKVVPGHSVEGILKESMYNGAISYSLDNPVTVFTPKGGGMKANMSQVMEKKAENIAVAQGNKELGIKVSSTMRMAVDITLCQIGVARDIAPDHLIEASVKKWREWLWKNWDVDDKSFPPF